jgi:hypothetical protein
VELEMTFHLRGKVAVAIISRKMVSDSQKECSNASHAFSSCAKIFPHGRCV